MWWRIGRWALRAIAVVGVVGAAAWPAPAQVLDVQTAERELITLTNIGRTSNGLPSLRPNPSAAQVARRRSEDMADRNYFSHDIPPDGKTFRNLLDEANIAYQLAGENIEFNNASAFESVQFAQREFLNSPIHRAVWLSPQYREIGTGVARQGDRRYYTAIFLDPVPAGSSRPAPLTGAPAPPGSTTGPGVPAGPARALRPAPGHQPDLIEAVVHAVLRQRLGL